MEGSARTSIDSLVSFCCYDRPQSRPRIRYHPRFRRERTLPRSATRNRPAPRRSSTPRRRAPAARSRTARLSRERLLSGDQRRELSGVAVIGLGVIIAAILLIPGSGAAAGPVHNALFHVLGVGAWLAV